jgi:hypothetical protein
MSEEKGRVNAARAGVAGLVAARAGLVAARAGLVTAAAGTVATLFPALVAAQEAPAQESAPNVVVAPGEQLIGGPGVRVDVADIPVPQTVEEAIKAGYIIRVASPDDPEFDRINAQVIAAKKNAELFNQGINPFTGMAMGNNELIRNEVARKVNAATLIANNESIKWNKEHPVIDVSAQELDALARVQASVIAANNKNNGAEIDFNNACIDVDAVNLALTKQWEQKQEAILDEQKNNVRKLLTDLDAKVAELQQLSVEFPEYKEKAELALSQIETIILWAKAAQLKLDNGSPFDKEQVPTNDIDALNATLTTIAADAPAYPGVDNSTNSPYVVMNPDLSVAPADRPDLGVSTQLASDFQQFIQGVNDGKKPTNVAFYVQNVGENGNEDDVSLWMGVTDPEILNRLPQDSILRTQAYLGSSKELEIDNVTPEKIADWLNKKHPLSESNPDGRQWTVEDVLRASTHVLVRFMTVDGELLPPYADIRGAELTSGLDAAKALNRVVITPESLADYIELVNKGRISEGKEPISAVDLKNLVLDTAATRDDAYTSLKADGDTLPIKIPNTPDILQIRFVFPEGHPKYIKYPDASTEKPAVEQLSSSRQLAQAPYVVGDTSLALTGNSLIVGTGVAGVTCIAGGSIVLAYNEHLRKRDGGGRSRRRDANTPRTRVQQMRDNAAARSANLQDKAAKAAKAAYAPSASTAPPTLGI